MPKLNYPVVYCGSLCLQKAMQDLKSILGRMLSDPPPPPEPTNHLPGTPGKVRVLAQRFLAGQVL